MISIVAVTNHAIDQFRKRIIGGKKHKRHASDDEIRETILRCIAAAVPVEIPTRFKIKSLLTNDGIPAVYLWHGPRQIMFVVSPDSVVMTCYPMDRARLQDRPTATALRAVEGGSRPRRLRGRHMAARFFDRPQESADPENVDDENDILRRSGRRRYRRIRPQDLVEEIEEISVKN